MTLEELYKIIEDRKKNMPEGSYVASLFKEGSDRIIQKVGEESTEVIIAAKNEKTIRIIEEVSDLIFHVLVLLVEKDIPFSNIEDELSLRNNTKTLNKEGK